MYLRSASRRSARWNLGKAFPKEINPLMIKIKSNKARVTLCGDIIESTHRHDFRSCKCGEIYVDGGRECLRRLARNFDNLEELSEYHESEGEF